jgi:hypothetical protein
MKVAEGEVMPLQKKGLITRIYRKIKKLNSHQINDPMGN